jgi:hypothetical protein
VVVEVAAVRALPVLRAAHGLPLMAPASALRAPHTPRALVVIPEASHAPQIAPDAVGLLKVTRTPSIVAPCQQPLHALCIDPCIEVSYPPVLATLLLLLLLSHRPAGALSAQAGWSVKASPCSSARAAATSAAVATPAPPLPRAATRQTGRARARAPPGSAKRGPGPPLLSSASHPARWGVGPIPQQPLVVGATPDATPRARDGGRWRPRLLASVAPRPEVEVQVVARVAGPVPRTATIAAAYPAAAAAWPALLPWRAPPMILRKAAPAPGRAAHPGRTASGA